MIVNRWHACKSAFSVRPLTRSLVVALVIGVVLTAINQGDVVLAGEKLNITKAGLTFLVPFCVSTFSAYGAAVDRQRHG